MRIILVLPTNMLLVCDATMAASAYVQEEPKPEEEPEDAAFPKSSRNAPKVHSVALLAACSEARC